jgi:hypothetical protein
MSKITILKCKKSFPYVLKKIEYFVAKFIKLPNGKMSFLKCKKTNGISPFGAEEEIRLFNNSFLLFKPT